MSKKYTLLTFKGICMNFLLELKFFILCHPVPSKQPHKVVQIHMGHPVYLLITCNHQVLSDCILQRMKLIHQSYLRTPFLPHLRVPFLPHLSVPFFPRLQLL